MPPANLIDFARIRSVVGQHPPVRVLEYDGGLDVLHFFARRNPLEDQIPKLIGVSHSHLNHEIGRSGQVANGRYLRQRQDVALKALDQVPRMSPQFDRDHRPQLHTECRGVDLGVVDTAHGHSKGVLQRIRWVRKTYPDVQLIGGMVLNERQIAEMRTGEGKTLVATLAAYLLEDHRVASVPGVAFGADEFQRLSYATSMKNIEKGIDRIEQAVKALQ